MNKCEGWSKLEHETDDKVEELVLPAYYQGGSDQVYCLCSSCANDFRGEMWEIGLFPKDHADNTANTEP